MISYSTSTLYDAAGNYASTTDQGAIYFGTSSNYPSVFTFTSQITNPVTSALYLPTVSNYPQKDMPMFMGSFTGVWVHKIYNDGFLVLAIQTANQDLYIPVQFDTVESVSLLTIPNEIGYVAAAVPPIPTPSVIPILALGMALFSRKRKKNTNE
jgi:hypothetical protein